MKLLAVHPSGLMYTRVFLRLEPLGLELVAGAARQAGHTVRILDLQVETPELEVLWDRYAFLRIFDNLVINAAKHGEAGTPIQVRQWLADDQVMLELRNLGQFPDEVLANLATPYFISTRSDKRGWGLGLPIVKALSESFGGEVRFANGAGEVVITLHLPLRLA